MNLRPYQQKAITEARNSILKGNKKILIALGTGGGKSIIVRSLFEMTLAKKPNAKLLYIVHRTILINQMRNTLKGLNVEISTLQKIGKSPTIEYDLVLSDETHFGHGSKLMGNINYKFFIGVTATPITPNGYPLSGYDDILDIAQLKDLIDWGFMPPLKVLSTSKVDTSKLKVSGKDFNMGASYDLMSKSEIKKDLLNTYEKYAKGLKTIIYCVNVEHSEEVAKEFADAGYRCEAVHSKTDKTALEKFKNNELDILTNCDVLTTGLDLPDIYCLMLASPTKSYIKSTQIYGRIRLNPKDKEKVGLILDCCNVVENTQHPYARFDFTREKQKNKDKLCQCGETMFIAGKKTTLNDKFTFTTITRYKCRCGIYEDVEKMGCINYNFCSECGNVLTPDNKMEMKQSKKAIEFVITCDCGCDNVQRSILLTDKELKEIKLQETINGANTWDKVYEILKLECKKWNYKWQWSQRCIETLKNKNKTPDEVMKEIEKLQSTNTKIGRLMYV